MNISQLEEKIRRIIDKDEHPLETMYKAEVAFYEQSCLELKQLHIRNLQELLNSMKIRGLKSSPITRKVAERIATL